MHTHVLAVLGGGQLGRMLGLAAASLGVRCRFLDPAPDACARDVGELLIGSFDDEGALAELTRGATHATFEWEGVPAASASFVAGRVPLAPSLTSLAASQDRVTEKQTFVELGIPTAPFRAVSSRADLDTAIEAIGFPAVLKTRRGGYDGKGQAVLRGSADVDDAWQRLDNASLILETFVSFERELSMVATRSSGGAIVHWPLAENSHEDGILRLTRAPAPDASSTLEGEALTLVTALLEHFAFVGTLAIELFQTPDGLLANEFAPRVHNSGHWTVDGATTSQFENHVRALLGLPLGATIAHGACAMVNFLGEMADAHDVLAIEGAHLHDYRKSPRPGRKVGHATVLAPSADALEPRVEQLLALARTPSPTLEHS